MSFLNFFPPALFYENPLRNSHATFIDNQLIPAKLSHQITSLTHLLLVNSSNPVIYSTRDH